MVVLSRNSERIGPTNVSGAADLVVEIVSPDSFERDRGSKFLEYEKAGVPEYWIIDPDREVAEFYLLVNGRFQLQVVTDGRYTASVLPTVWVKPAWFWQDPLPRLRQVLREWGAL